MSTRVEMSLLVLTLAIAAILRLLWLDTIPPGWHHDEALMGIMASEVYRGVQRPIFFPSFLGQEPLYIYLSAGLMWLMGGNQDILPLRITSALIGIATVGVTYLLGREMYGRRVGLISAVLVALSFWQVMLSREAYRVITQPLLEGLTIFLLWRATRLESRSYYIAGGIALGGTIYTYLGARLFPGVLVLFALWWVLTRGWPPAEKSLRVATSAIAAAVVSAPLLIYFARHPGTFAARINQVLVFQPGVLDVGKDPVLTLGENLVKLLATFTVHGETLWRYNISGRPIFVGIVALLFYVGLIVVIYGVIRKRAGSAMVIAWVTVMLFPSFLSYDVGAYTFRSMGLVPVIYLVPAVGLVAAWDWAIARLSHMLRFRVEHAFVALVAVILLVEGGITYRDYFTIWANSFGAAYENMDDILAAARYLDREARPATEEIFVSTDLHRHAVIAHLAPTVYPHVRWFDGNSSVVFPTSNERNSLYLFPFSALPKGLDAFLPSEAIVDRSFFQNGTTKLVVYRLTPSQVELAVRDLLGNPTLTKESTFLGDEVELLAYRIDRRVVQGEELGVTVLWRVLKDAPAPPYVVFAHLLDHRGAMWAQYDTPAFPTSEWRAGDVVVGQYALKISRKVAPGKYSVAWGVYDRATLARLPIKGGHATGDTMHLGFAKVASRGQEAIAPTTLLRKKIGEAIELEGFDFQREETANAPSVVRVDLHWTTRATPTEDYTVFVQMLSPEGRLVAQSDSQPVAGGFPTSFWEPGEKIVDRHELKVDKSLPSGRYSVIAGMYLLASGKRLPVEGGGDYVPLTKIDVP